MKWLIITQDSFWNKKMGADLTIIDKFVHLNGEKILLFIGKISNEKKVEIQKAYNISKIYTIKPFRYSIKRLFRFALSKLHLNVFYFLKNPYKFSSMTKNKVKKICEENKIDCILVEYVWFGRIIEKLKYNSINLIETHDIQNVFCKSVKKEDKSWKLSITEKEEIDIYKKYDYVLAVSKSDFEYYSKKLDNAFYLPPFKKTNQKYTNVDNSILKIGFVGGVAEFNRIAIEWFLSNVYDEKDNYILNIYGAVCNSINSNQKNIVLNGFVENFDDIYTKNHIFVNPTFVIGGIKTKNLEALSYGKTVLTTNEGARSLEQFESCNGVYIINTPDEFKERISYFINHIDEINENGQLILDEYNKTFANEEIKNLNYMIEERIDDTKQ